MPPHCILVAYFYSPGPSESEGPWPVPRCEYFWGPDMSGAEQGAGGVGGLLAVSMDSVFYIPCYDHNGNIVRYVSESGAIAAEYVYHPYGGIAEESGPLAAVFTFGFSTKVHDRKTGLVAYQRRFLRPAIGRWLNRDPIENNGGENLYVFCGNDPTYSFDPIGLKCKTLNGPYPIPGADWTLKRYRLVNFTATSRAPYVDGADVTWMLVGKVECCCSFFGFSYTKTKKVYKEEVVEISFDEEIPILTPESASALTVPTPVSIGMGIGEIGAAALSNAIQPFLPGMTDIMNKELIQKRINESKPQSLEYGKWKGKLCE